MTGTQENRKESLKTQIHRIIFLSGIALFILSYLFFPHINSLSVVILTLNWLIEGQFVQKFKSSYKNKFISLFISLYIIFGIGILYSEILPEALSHAETKLGILILPVIFGTTDLSKKYFDLFLKLFVAAVSFALLICYGNLILSIIYSEPESAISSISNFHNILGIHRTYFGLSIAFSICIVVYFLISKAKAEKSYRNLLILTLVFLLISILVLGSRMPTLSLALLFLILFIRYIGKSSKRLKLSLTVLVIAFAIIGILLFKYSSSFDKYKKISSDLRFEIWPVAANLMQESLPFGYGTGDVKEIRNRYYLEHGMKDLYERNLNFHNQYLETILQVGIPGIIILIAVLIIPLYLSVKHKNFLYFSFLFLIIFGFLTESMLHTQKGVLFYAFFNSFIFFYNNRVL